MRMPSLHTVVWRETTGWNVTIIQPQWWSKVMCAGRPQNIMLQKFVSSISRNQQYATSYWHYVTKIQLLTLYWNTSCILVTCQLTHCIWMTFDWFCTFMSRVSQKEVTQKNWDIQEVRKCVNKLCTNSSKATSLQRSNYIQVPGELSINSTQVFAVNWLREWWKKTIKTWSKPIINLRAVHRSAWKMHRKWC